MISELLLSLPILDGNQDDQKHENMASNFYWFKRSLRRNATPSNALENVLHHSHTVMEKTRFWTTYSKTIQLIH